VGTAVKPTIVLASTDCGWTSDPTTAATTAARRTRALPDALYTITCDRDRLFAARTHSSGGRASHDLAAGIGYEVLRLKAKDGTSQTRYLDILPASLAVSPGRRPRGCCRMESSGSPGRSAGRRPS
jgi:hypothetical protein